MSPPSLHRDRPPAPDRTATYREVDGQSLEIDLYLPAPGSPGSPAGSPRGPAAAVLCIHGGGWARGGRHQFAWHGRDLAGHGFIAAVPSYRLAPRATYPAALEDCAAALAWLRGQAAALSLDPARIGAVGSSAGGYLAACLGVDHPAAAGRADDGSAALPRGLRGVVDIHGLHDLPPLADTAVGETCARFLGGTLAERPGMWNEASPMRYVDRGEAAFVLFHDPGDPLAPFDQSARFAEALRRAGRSVRLIATPGTGHGFIYNPDNPWSRRVWPVARRWLARRLM